MDTSYCEWGRFVVRDRDFFAGAFRINQWSAEGECRRRYTHKRARGDLRHKGIGCSTKGRLVRDRTLVESRRARLSDHVSIAIRRDGDAEAGVIGMTAEISRVDKAAVWTDLAYECIHPAAAIPLQRIDGRKVIRLRVAGYVSVSRPIDRDGGGPVFAGSADCQGPVVACTADGSARPNFTAAGGVGIDLSDHVLVLRSGSQ